MISENYKIFEFNYQKANKKDNNENFSFKNYKYEYIYLITKKDYLYCINKKGYSPSNINFICNYSQYQNLLEHSDNNELILVNKNFFKCLDIDNDKISKDKRVGHFISGNKHFIKFSDNEVLEIRQKSENNKEIESINKELNGIDQKEILLRALILLYANEKHFEKLLISPLDDVYELKEYFLINYDYIEKFKKANDYGKLKAILDKENYNYSYNGFLVNIKKIMNKFLISNTKINLNKIETINEKDFYPNSTLKLKELKDIYCPDKFILVPENLFILFYKYVKNSNLSKNDYKYKILVGDNVLFLKDRNSSSTFYAYLFTEIKFKLYYLFQFNDESLFYEEIKEYIKQKGIINFILMKNLDFNTSKSELSSINDNYHNELFKYINTKKIEKDEIKNFKKIAQAEKIKNIAYFIRGFIETLIYLEDNKINKIDINDICSKINNSELKYIKVGLILDEDFIKLKEKLFYKEINESSRYSLKKNIEEEEKLNNLLFKSNQKDLIDFTKQLKIYNPDDIDKEKNKDKVYNMINIKILEMITELEYNQVEECFYFKSNNRYFFYSEKGENYMKL